MTATSRRHQVTTSGQQMQKSTIQPRRDVISKICISSFNVRRAQKLGDRGACDGRHRISEQSNTVFKELLGICIGFHFLDIFGSHDDVFRTIHFVSFFHDVLNLFLGLYKTLSQTMD